MTEILMESALLPFDRINAEVEPATGFEDEGAPTDERAPVPVMGGDAVPRGEIAARSEERGPVDTLIAPLQPPRSVALYIDGDNQSPAIARDLLASVRRDWGLEVARVVLAGNDHGHSVPRWLAALASDGLPEDRILALRVPRTPEAADLAVILELGANMERHRQGPDLVVIVSRDEWLIRAAEMARARGCRIWVAYAENEAAPAQTHLPTLLLPAVQRGHAMAKALIESTMPTVSVPAVTPSTVAPTAKPIDAAPAVDPTPSHRTLLAQVRARCKVQPGGGYLASEVGQVLYRLGLTDKAARNSFLKAIDGLREIGVGGAKILIL